MKDVAIGLISSAIGFAISPISIIQLILVVFSKRARVNGIVFLLTLAVPLLLLPVLGATAVKAATDGAGTQGMNPWIQLVFGVLLVLIAFMNLRSYNSTEAPKVFDTIQGMGPGAVFFLALGVTLLNPKNLALLLSAGNTMRVASLPLGTVLIASAAFTVLAMTPFLAVVGYQLLGGAKAADRLDRLRTSLLKNNHKIMFWVCALLAAVFLFRALPALMG